MPTIYRDYILESQVYRDQLALAHPGLGHALWHPQQGFEGPILPIEIGDLGLVRPISGQFVRLCNILLPGDQTQASFGLPENYEPLQLIKEDHIDRETLNPHNFCSLGISGVSTALCALTFSTAKYTSSLRPQRKPQRFLESFQTRLYATPQRILHVRAPAVSPCHGK
jgi:hypothetical protein